MLEILYLLALVRGYRRRRNPQRQQSGRDLEAFHERIWREAAEHVGATYRPLGFNIADITRGDARVRTVENTCSIDDPVTLAIALNKLLTYQLLGENGIPTPRHVGFTLRSLDRAVAFLKSSRGECVVKPAGGTGGGRGVTTGLRDVAQVARAAAAAAVYSGDLLIEEQVEGDNYRLLYLDGVLLDAFVRKYPTVVGDGRSSIAQLVRNANAERLRSGSGLSQVQLTIDLDMRRTLAKQGLSLRSVPPAGANVRLKTVVNENLGADNTTATGRLCRSLIEDGARAARSLHVRLAGIDIITGDPEVPLAESGGAVIEVNTTPNFYYHYNKSDGRFPVAIHVLEALLSGPARDADAAAADPGLVRFQDEPGVLS
jgi:cyanophycin synthetase